MTCKVESVIYSVLCTLYFVLYMHTQCTKHCTGSNGTHLCDSCEKIIAHDAALVAGAAILQRSLQLRNKLIGDQLGECVSGYLIGWWIDWLVDCLVYGLVELHIRQVHVCYRAE